MESRAKLLGHSVHQILIVFPLGLLATAVIFDGIYLGTGIPTMHLVAYWMLVAGIIGGLVAAPFGVIDWLAIPWGTRAKMVGMAHAGANVLALVLFTGSWLLRVPQEEPVILAYVLGFAGAGLALLGGWLGGELVARLGVGVYDGAHLNSPNSLSNRPAYDQAGTAVRR